MMPSTEEVLTIAPLVFFLTCLLYTSQALDIAMKILRDGKVAFEGTVNTSQMKRSIQELGEYLKRDNTLRRFTLLMTGTSIVPPDDFTLHDGDTVEIEIEGIGCLLYTSRCV